MEDKKEFIEYLKEERRQMARVASGYMIDSHRILRTQIDSLLIAYDQAVERLSLFDVSKSVCECKDEWLTDVRINVMKCKKCGQEF